MHRSVGFALIVAVALTASDLSAQYSSVRVQVVDVGQADGILIRTPNSHWVLIDAGQDGLLGDSLRTQFGVDRLDLVVGSHRHYDHVGGMDEVLNAVPVGQVFFDTTDVSNRAFDDAVRNALEQRGIRVRNDTSKADTLDVDGVRFIVLPGGPEKGYSDENDNSIVIRMEFGQFSMLFPGDAETTRRDWLEEHYPTLLDVDVLKAAHHGSRNGTDSAWLATVTPQDVVISAGVSGVYKHPHPEAVSAYEEVANGRVFCTNRQGTIRVYGYADGRIRIYRQRESTKSCAYDGTWY